MRSLSPPPVNVLPRYHFLKKILFYVFIFFTNPLHILPIKWLHGRVATQATAVQMDVGGLHGSLAYFLKSRPVPLIKSPKMDMMMRYDRSSVTLAIKNKLHRSLVAQVPANATRSRQSLTSTAQRRRPLAAASKPIQTAPLPDYPNRPFASHAAEESSSWQHLDVAQRPPNRSRLQDGASKPTVAAPRRVATHHRVLS